MADQYDVIVVGSGTAGQTAAYELKRLGLTVAVVEHSDRPGGTCALRGCQAKKWFYEGTETVARSRHLAGIGVLTPALASWRQLRDEKNKFTGKVPSNTVDGLARAGIDFIRGRARFSGKSVVSVGDRQLASDFIVLACGAAPMKLTIDGARMMITSSEFLELEHLPRRIVFVGGGFISFEFAHFAARLGAAGTRCTILEAGRRALVPFDEEMVDLLVEASQAEGIEVRCNVTITAIEQSGSGFKVVTQDGPAVEADLVVHGAGRAPDIEDLDLERAGVEHARRGIEVDETMATSNPKVYAIGDCAATVQLARVADAEAMTAAANIAAARNDTGAKKTMDYTAVPSVLFTYPQYAMVGSTEAALQKAGVAYRKSVANHLSWPTYRRVGMKTAAYKLLAGEDGMLLGGHILCDNATGLIHALSLAMVNRIAVETFYRQSVMTPYPSRESDILYMLKPLLG